MTVKKSTRPRPTAPELEPLSTSPPWTMEERQLRIEAMSLRIISYVQFMCKAANQHGSSPEAKDRAVTAFYEKMVLMERQLGKIQEELLLE